MNLYGSNQASTQLTSACKLFASVGGVETTVQMTYPTGTGKQYAEIWSKGNTAYPASACYAALPAPLGNGWVYQPGAGTFAAANWSATANVAFTSALSTNSNLTMRFYKYASGVYTSIGTLPGTIASIGSTTKQAVTFSAVSLPSIAFVATDLLYTDLWLYDPSAVGADDPTLYESSSAANGVAGDVAIVTSLFSTGSTRTIVNHKAFGRLR